MSDTGRGFLLRNLSGPLRANNINAIDGVSLTALGYLDTLPQSVDFPSLFL